MIKAIIFDMDGVLIDATEWHYEALNRALYSFGYEISLDDHISTFAGLTTRRKLEILSLAYGLPEELHDSINEQKQSYTMEIVHARCRASSNHEYALSRLRQDGYKVACCSNSIRSTVEVTLRRAALAIYLDFIISNEDIKTPKPDPEMYNTAIARFGLLPQECLIVEDNARGIMAAKASGAHVMEVKGASELTYEAVCSQIAKYSDMLRC